MLTGVCIVLAVVVAVLVIERRRPNPDVATLVKTIDRILGTVSEMADRIQAPHLAGVRAQEVEPESNPASVDTNDDEDFWESREALAERMSMAERNGDE